QQTDVFVIGLMLLVIIFFAWHKPSLFAQFFRQKPFFDKSPASPVTIIPGVYFYKDQMDQGGVEKSFFRSQFCFKQYLYIMEKLFHFQLYLKRRSSHILNASVRCA